MERKTDNRKAEKKTALEPKTPYTKPELTIYGTVGNITEGGVGGAPDPFGS